MKNTVRGFRTVFFYIDLNWAYCFLQLYPISIRPSGKMLGALLDFIIIDRPKDTGPTLPMNMVRHRMIRDRGSSLPVTPALRPYQRQRPPHTKGQ